MVTPAAGILPGITRNVVLKIAREALGRLKGVNNDAVAKAIAGALDKAKGTAAFVELARDFGAKGQGAALLATAVKLGNDPAAVQPRIDRLECQSEDYGCVVMAASSGISYEL